MIIRTRTPARAGLIGNPSDGFNGVTISFTFDAFWAEVELWESPELEIRPAPRDATRFASIDDLVHSVTNYGYYGGIRLIKAIIKVFADYCQSLGIELDRKNFTISYRSNIPLRVGLAGSSAIIASTLKALMRFYGVSIPKQIMPNLILKAETEELKIGAGLQDRVVQTYGGVVYMDFDRELMTRGFGHYENLDPALLPPLFIAYDDSATEGTEVFHNDVRERYARGEKLVVETMEAIAEGARQFRKAMEEGDLDEMERLINRNFELRSQIYQINDLNRRLIQTAREAGASVKFCGSGGAVIGICRDEEMFHRLQKGYQAIGATILRPRVITYDELDG
ncbi:MAG TPA: GHMP kinase [Caldilineae bacterium]|nr:GHMP kinase [Caldilineae bacterium]